VTRAALALLLVAAAGSGAPEPPFQARARALVGADHGVFVRAADGTVLAALNPDRPYHPASVTKIATSLAMLEKLGPDHRFETRLVAGGPVRGGVLAGDLVVEAGGDPFLVDEDAVVLLGAMRRAGVRQVAGGLRVHGPLLFDWQPDPDGALLRRALEGGTSPAALAAVRAASNDVDGLTPADLALPFGGETTAENGDGRPFLVHRSPPLARLLKALNCYSNNVFHPLSNRIGGPAVVQAVARAHVPAAVRASVVIHDAAGAGRTNRLSARAAVALVDALADALARHGHRLTDALPVAGLDPGTLRERLHGGAVVGKTGTIGSLAVSALAGRVRTARWGEVTFAVLHHGLRVPEAHRRQDAFVTALLDAGGAIPWSYRADALPSFTEGEVRALP
jgi:serine-type D-Ala-D-Ala carboxypeptidase/endopeptidase (penicillin-binding protein 4)